MAILHRAELRPTKIEAVVEWAPDQPWFPREAAGASLEVVGAFRFDDPDGEVGIETLLVQAGDGLVLQVPLTYRGAPLAGAEAWLVTTMQHSVLGDRWVYDGAADPVYVAAVAHAIATGGHQAELEVEADGERVRREPTALVSGSGGGAAVPSVEAADIAVRHEAGATFVVAGSLSLEILRALTATVPDDGGTDGTLAGTLAGTWSGQESPRTLVRLS